MDALCGQQVTLKLTSGDEVTGRLTSTDPTTAWLVRGPTAQATPFPLTVIVSVRVAPAPSQPLAPPAPLGDNERRRVYARWLRTSSLIVAAIGTVQAILGGVMLWRSEHLANNDDSVYVLSGGGLPLVVLGVSAVLGTALPLGIASEQQRRGASTRSTSVTLAPLVGTHGSGAQVQLSLRF